MHKVGLLTHSSRPRSRAPVNEEEEEEPEWELERILDRRSRARKFQYLVQYKGYTLLSDCEWRPEAELRELAPDLSALSPYQP